MGDNKLTSAQSKELFVKKDHFLHNAFILFMMAKDIVQREKLHGEKQARMNQTLEKMLHSILFLGNIHKLNYSPEQIFNDSEILTETKRCFPRPFKQYRTHLPLRTPFSYFMQLVFQVSRQRLCGQRETVRCILSEMFKRCKKAGGRYPLISTVVCICKSGKTACFGVPLGSGSDLGRQIMLAVSCVNVWHPYASSAEVPFLTEETQARCALTLPHSVKFSIYEARNMWQKKRSLNPSTDRMVSTRVRLPVICAKTEAISKLLDTDEHVCSETKIGGDTFNQEEMEDRMTAYFNAKMTERMKKKNPKDRDEYRIDVIYFPETSRSYS